MVMSDSVSEQAKGKEVADYKVELLLGEFVDTVWDGITANPSIISILKRIGLGSPSSTGQKTAANSTSVVPASDWASENHLGEVAGKLFGVSANFTRPNDSTAYAAKDVVCNSTSAPAVLTFSNAFRLAAGNLYVVKAKLTTDQVANTATFRLWLYNTAPTPVNDNAPFTLLWANRATRIGYIDFPALSTEGTGSDCAESIVLVSSIGPLTAIGAAADANLYAVLEATSAFTPAALQNFHIGLTFDQN